MIKYIGLDFESSGSNPWGQHVPIQIGMAVEVGNWQETFVSHIGGWQFDNYNDPAANFEWSEEAWQVHGINKDVVMASPPVWTVDIRAANWIIEKVGYSNRMNTIIVGWNVGGFDRQFITRWMPNLNRLLSYRTLDLNSLVFRLAWNDEKAYKHWKDGAKKYADGRMSGGALRHDAMFDAQAALYEMEWLMAPQQVGEKT